MRFNRQRHGITRVGVGRHFSPHAITPAQATPPGSGEHCRAPAITMAATSLPALLLPPAGIRHAEHDSPSSTLGATDSNPRRASSSDDPRRRAGIAAGGSAFRRRGRDIERRRADAAARLGLDGARTVAGQRARLPGVLRPLLRRARLSAVRRALGRRRRTGRRDRKRQRLAPAARTRGAGCHPRSLPTRLGRTSAAVHGGQDPRGRVRPRRDVLQGVSGQVRLAAQRRRPHRLQPAGPVRPARSPVPSNECVASPAFT